jgi:hypothetical protein
LDLDKNRALSEFYREEFTRYLDYMNASGVLDDGGQDALRRTCAKLLGDLDRICDRSDFPAVAETLLQNFDTLTHLSTLETRQRH